MREMHVELGGEQITLAATFKASVEIADRVADPLEIARESAVEATLLAQSMPYQPKFRFDIKNVPLILWIGMKAAGDSRKLEDVQELVFENGFIASRDIALNYLVTIVTPKTDQESDAKQDQSSGN